LEKNKKTKKQKNKKTKKQKNKKQKNKKTKEIFLIFLFKMQTKRVYPPVDI
jgi:hypothetical protein